MPEQTVYLTFDDGPMPGTDDIIQVLKDKKVKGTLFMVATHVTSSWRKSLVNEAHKSQYVEVGNHSNVHANHEYAAYYSKHVIVGEGFKKAKEILGLKGQKIIARLPGRNTWRVDNIIKNDLGSGNAADLLAKKGYVIYGWDVEWKMTKNGKAKEEPGDVVKKIQNVLSGSGKRIKTKKKDKVIVLMHDIMFRSPTGGKKKLEQFIDELRQAGFKFDFVSNY